jgi:hypothetical protein
MIPASSFWSEFLRMNHLPPHWRWLGLPGMNFKAQSAWWRKARRHAPHEGIDLLYLVDSRGQLLTLPPQALVAPLWEGEVVALLDDFLGSTVVVRHPIGDDQNRWLGSFYAHVAPLVDQGALVSPNLPLARITLDKKQGKSAPPAHLHLSLAWLAAGYPATELRWSTLWANPAVQLLDPLTVLEDEAVLP